MARTTGWALKAAQQLDCRVFAVSVLVPTAVQEADDAEERAWKSLYEIEDDAFRQNTRISLLLEQGDPQQRVLSLAKNYDIELAVLRADTHLSPAELVRKTPCPLVFVR
jgi:nucleotide-binding universal stress UspA family protein